MPADSPIAVAEHYLKDVARAYAAIFFLDSAVAGAALLAATFLYPNIGAAGLLAALIGTAAAGILRFPPRNNFV